MLPMKQEGECRRGRAQKEEDQLCSGFTHTYILYYTILTQEKTTTRTRLRAAFGVAWLHTQFFVSSPASAGLIFHGTLFHESGQTLNFLKTFKLQLDTHFFSLLSLVDPAKRRRNNNNAAVSRSSDTS